MKILSYRIIVFGLVLVTIIGHIFLVGFSLFSILIMPLIVVLRKRDIWVCSILLSSNFWLSEAQAMLIWVSGSFDSVILYYIPNIFDFVSPLFLKLIGIILFSARILLIIEAEYIFIWFVGNWINKKILEKRGIIL